MLQFSHSFPKITVNFQIIELKTYIFNIHCIFLFLHLFDWIKKIITKNFQLCAIIIHLNKMCFQVNFPYFHTFQQFCYQPGSTRDILPFCQSFLDLSNVLGWISDCLNILIFTSVSSLAPALVICFHYSM